MVFFERRASYGPSRTTEEREVRKNETALARENAERELKEGLQEEHLRYVAQQHEIEPLTGLKRREIFNRDLEKSLEIIRGEQPDRRGNVEPLTRVSVIMIDLDHFKKVNDTFGHAAGDEVLRQVPHVIQDSIRAIGMAARYGGEELIVLLPNASAEVAARLAESIRVKIEQLVFEKYPELKVTASMGVACSSPAALYPKQLLKNADDVLYQAKGNGRNRVEMYTDK